MSVDIDTRNRQRELGAFLRSRRERRRPADAGLPETGRRRTPGLRREEVAMAAGVGTTWYTWLEQGRDANPSIQVLSALSRVLGLDATERRHLFTLSGRDMPPATSNDTGEADESLRHLLDAAQHQPAYVVGRRWDVLAWNRAASAVYGDYGCLEGDARNILHLVFTNPDHRRLLVDWEMVARTGLAQFRAISARYVGDPDFERLIAILLEKSAEFRHWWPIQDVSRQVSGIKRINHPIAGSMIFEHMGLSIDDGSDRRLVVFTPLAQHDTLGKLKALLAAEA